LNIRGLAAALSCAVLSYSGALLSSPGARAEGYFRFPALAGDLAIFTAEGDLWSVPLAGGRASRLTTHAGRETNAVASPDDKSIAFTASYDGPREVYVMPLAGGLPRRVSFEGEQSVPVGWTPAGEVLYVTQHATGPTPQLVIVAVDPATLQRRTLPLADVSDAAVSPDGRTLYFTRFGMSFSSDNVRDYRGGLQSQLWRYELSGTKEAEKLLPVAEGKPRFNDRQPMPWRERLYFISDRDGRDNLWSTTLDGGDLTQLTFSRDFNLRSARLDRGRIVYQLGADLRVFDIAAGSDRALAIDLPSDFDQERRRVVRRPLEFFEYAALSPDGERVAVTARGRVALMSVGPLRRIDIATPPASRAAEAVVSRDGRSVYVILEDAPTSNGAADEVGAPQIWSFRADGSGPGKALTRGDAGHRRGLVLSPDGKLLASATLGGQLFLLDIERGENRLIDTAPGSDLGDVVWSADSRYLTFVRSDSRLDRAQIFLFEPATGKKARLTSDRFLSYAPAFTPDGKWLYFLSDREFRSLNLSPWGDRNTGPYFDRRTRIYALALQPGLHFPFQPKDELTATPPPSAQSPAPQSPASQSPASQSPGPQNNAPQATGSQPAGANTATPNPATPRQASPKLPAVEWEGLADRLYEVPVDSGTYRSLHTDGKLLYFLDEISGSGGRRTLRTLKIERDERPQDFLADVRQVELSADGKKLFLRRWAAGERVGDMYIVPAGAKPPERLSGAPTELGRARGEVGRATGEFGRLLEALDHNLVRASDWTLTIDPRAEWRQLFATAWRLHRDHFYDRDMKGVDWLAVRRKYQPLVERVTDRDELNDVLAQMMGELGTMHSQIRPGELRAADDSGKPGFLGAVLAVEPGGARIRHIYRSYAELPRERGPLAEPGVDARVGDLIVAVNGRAVNEARDIAELLDGHAGQQVLLVLKRATTPASPGSARQEREIRTVVKVVDAARNAQLRYGDWEEGRRAVVEQAGGGRIGYLHLRAMTAEDMAVFAREFYAQLDREGLIIDVRRNNGGNIDSWIIEKLLRRAWAFWKPRYGERHDVNMQQSFRGQLAVLVDERTYSDGEAFAAGVKKLNLGPLIGARTAGAGVWLNDYNTRLADFGNARTAQYPMFDVDQGKILVENWGVEPDIVVDNLPHATFEGDDAQLTAAIKTLLGKLGAK
jgi:tricorn protease